MPIKDDPVSPTPTVASGAAHIVQGAIMGTADAIPGVSGGTMALILGIYDRLVNAITRFDRAFLQLVLKGQLVAAFKHVDGVFVGCLAAGMAMGVILLGALMNTLLASPTCRAGTLAAFFGMILASSVLVWKMIRDVSGTRLYGLWGLALAGIAVALIVTMTAPTSIPEPSLPYLFLCGMVGICAMILPGLSGAYLLLIMGVYVDLTNILKQVLHGSLAGEHVRIVFVFGCGCAVGLMAFSRFLKWLLNAHHDGTMAVLCGFMIGALYKIWPFQIDHTPEIVDLDDKRFEHFFPAAFDSSVAIVLILIGVAGAAVFAISRVANTSRQPAAAEESTAEFTNLENRQNLP